jgi:acetate kinase
MGIRACQAVLPNVPQVAVFDTAFHQTMPPKAFRYAIPNKYYEDLHIRKYGFHGTSHRYVSGRAIEVLGLPAGSKVIVCHLGNGSSLSACVDGKCVDTSMGITPLDGLVMGTRCGTLDPAVVEFICNREGITVTECINMMNKKSGLAGITGSSDMRDVTARFDAGDKDATLALDMWAYTLKKYIGSYAAAMGGVDAIIFTAGIGENHVRAREWACEGLEFMGVKIDKERNAAARDEAKISADDSKVQVWVIPTNEELAIANDTLELTSK